MLDGEGGKPGIGDARPARIRFPAQPLEDGPVPCTGFDNQAVGTFDDIAAEAECLIQRTGIRPVAKPRCDPHDAA